MFGRREKCWLLPKRFDGFMMLQKLNNSERLLNPLAEEVTLKLIAVSFFFAQFQIEIRLKLRSFPSSRKPSGGSRFYQSVQTLYLHWVNAS